MMVAWWWVPATVVVTLVLALWVTANRCEDEAARRYRAGVEEGRYLERIGQEHDDIIKADLAISTIRRVGRLRAWGRWWKRDDERKQRVTGLVERGAGL